MVWFCTKSLNPKEAALIHKLFSLLCQTAKYLTKSSFFYSKHNLTKLPQVILKTTSVLLIQLYLLDLPQRKLEAAKCLSLPYGTVTGRGSSYKAKSNCKKVFEKSHCVLTRTATPNAQKYLSALSRPLMFFTFNWGESGGKSLQVQNKCCWNLHSHMPPL